jgi:hypothetical protein
MGFRAGLMNPPGFFVDGTFLDGAAPITAFEKIIDEALAGKPAKSPQ